jgi:hypothetical protein
VTVGEYNYSKPGKGGVLAHRVPLTWFVYVADPWAPGQVMLFVGQASHEQSVSVPTKLPTPKASRGARA